MSVGMEEGVGVAQAAGEEWLGRVRSGVAVPSALGQEDGCMVEDTSVQLYIKEKAIKLDLCILKNFKSWSNNFFSGQTVSF